MAKAKDIKKKKVKPVSTPRKEKKRKTKAKPPKKSGAKADQEPKKIYKRTEKGKFRKRGERPKRYNRPYVKPTQKSKYSQFRSDLSAYLRRSGIKLGELSNNRLALQNFGELSSRIWKYGKGFSASKIRKLIPYQVEQFVNEKNKQKGYGEKPVIPKSATVPQYYFNIDDLIWSDLPKHDYLFVTSCSILPKGMAIKLDGSELSTQIYYKSFKDWVDWCNEYHRLRGIDNSSKIDIFYAFAEEATENKQKKRWEIEIYSCDRFGNFNDFKYTPPKGEPCEETEEEIKVPEKEIIPPEEEKPVPPTRIEPTPAERIKILEKEIELEKEKRQTIVEKAKLMIKLKKAGFTYEQIKEQLG